VRYYIDAYGALVATATGDPNQYRHSPMWWLVAGTVPTLHGNLRWTQLDRFGDTLVGAFDLTPGEVRTFALPDRTFLSSAVGLGTCSQLDVVIDRRVVTPRFDLLGLPVNHVLSVAGMFVIPVGGPEVICCPRGLVGSLTTLALNHERTPALYATLVARARRVCAQLDMPDELVARAAPVAAAAALAATTVETAALGRVVNLFRSSWRLHSAALAFQPLRTISPWFAASLTTSAAAAVLRVGGPSRGSFAAIAGGAGLAALYLSWQNSHLWDEAHRWAQRRRDDQLALPVGGVAHFPADIPVMFPGLFNPKVPKPVLEDGGRITVDRAPDHRDDTAEQRTALGLVGLGFSTATPSAMLRHTAAAVNALGTRVLVATPPAQPGAWEAIIARLDDASRPLHEHCARQDEPPPDNFERWVERFPGPIQTELRVARNSLEDSALAPDDYRLGMIVKSEKTGLVDELGVSKNNARAVLSPCPRFNAAVGPEIYHFGMARREVRKLRHDSVVAWAISCTAEDLGQWFDCWTDYFSGPAGPAEYLVLDQSVYDAHQDQGALDFKLASYARSGVSAASLAAIRRAATPRGRVQNMPHVRFRGRRPRQISGWPITTDGNCATSEAALDDVLGPPGWDSYAVVILGDDVLAITRPHLCTVQSVQAGMLRLGLEVTATVTTHKHEVEFVSLVPYPTEDGTVFGPKIGRHLVRGGWSVAPESSDPYGMAISLEASVSFIPFLRQFYDLHRRLCKPVHGIKPHARLARQPHQACPETYEFVQARYGLTEADERAFEALLAGVTSTPAVLDWPRVNELWAVDA